MASNTTSNVVTFKVQDGTEFTVSKAAAMQSQLIQLMIENGLPKNAIPVPNVSSEILAKVIEYCEKHAEALKTEITNEGSSNMTEEDLKNWDRQFLEINRASLAHLMKAAEYLDISTLVDAICDLAVGNGMTKEEIMQIFG